MTDEVMFLCAGIAWGILMVTLTLMRRIAKGEQRGWAAAFWSFFGAGGFVLAGVSYYYLATSGHAKFAFWTALGMSTCCLMILLAQYRQTITPHGSKNQASNQLP